MSCSIEIRRLILVLTLITFIDVTSLGVKM